MNEIINNDQTINETINNQINNNQTIIIGFGKEDFTKLDPVEVFKCLKAGFNYPTEFVMYVNFNKDLPENHNIHILMYVTPI